MAKPSPGSKLLGKLYGHIEDIATALYGNSTSVCGTEVRYRNKGALSVDTEKQCYNDFEAGRGGDAFDLILLYFEDDQAAARAWAEDYLSGNPPKPKPRKPDKNQSDEGLAAYALSLLDRAQPSAGTVVEDYLKGRGITGPKLIESVSHLPDARYGEGAMLVISTNEAGSPLAVQLTYLTPNAEKSEIIPQRRTLKIDPQWADNGAVRFPGTGTLIVCEGAENAMSCAQATGQPALAVLGASNLGRYVPPDVNSLTLCPDGDAPDKNTHKTVDEAVDCYQLSGISDVRIAPVKFDTENQRTVDANDILQKKGADALKAVLAAAVPAELSYRGEIRRLAAMDPDDCAPQVKPVHAAMKGRGIDVSLGDFRDGIKRQRSDHEIANFHTEMLTSTALPSDELRDGGELLADIVAAIQSLVILEEPQALVAALYSILTHVFDAFDTCPRLFITAPTRAAGKTRLASVLARMVSRPLSTANASVAAMFRVIEAEMPTLVIGEVDTFLKQSEDHRNLINSGHFRDEAYVLRVVGDDYEPHQFSTYAPMILSGIGDMHNTIMSRSLVIQLKRKTKDEIVQRFDREMREHLHEFQSQIARWALENRPKIDNYGPPEPIETLDDRANDNAEPILVIARLCGPEWETKARQALLDIAMRPEEMAEEDLKTMALLDLRDCFIHEQQNFDKGVVFTKEVMAYLCGHHDRPWGEFGRSGKPLSEAKLGRLLHNLVPKSDKVSRGQERRRGFRWASCLDGFERYLPPVPGTPKGSVTIICTDDPAESDPPTPEINPAPEVGALKAAENCGSGHLDTSAPPASDISESHAE